MYAIYASGLTWQLEELEGPFADDRNVDWASKAIHDIIQCVYLSLGSNNIYFDSLHTVFHEHTKMLPEVHSLLSINNVMYLIEQIS